MQQRDEPGGLSGRVHAIVLGDPAGKQAALRRALANRGIPCEIVRLPGEAVRRAESARAAILIAGSSDARRYPALTIALPGRRTIVVVEPGDASDFDGEGVAAVIAADEADNDDLLAEVIGQAARSAAGSRRRETMLRWLERESERDALTGLYNRQAFEDGLAACCSASRENGTPISVVVVDVLGTKAVNEIYGMDAGTRMIDRAARVIGKCIRGTDIAARINGDDFGIVLPGAGLEDGRRVARRILHHVEEMNETEWADDIPIALAFGVASGTGCEPGELFDAALAQLRPQHHLVAVGAWGRYGDDDGPDVA